MLPMWASYIVKAYAWTLLLAKDGVAQWFLQHLGLEPLLTAFLTLPAVGGNTLSTSGLGRFLVFLYIWLPFMILPVQAALERLPPSLLQASADLGARPRQTFRYVVLPNLSSALLAGGMLAFALSFDEIIVTTFTAGHERTLPLWLLNQLGRPRDVPVTNVVALLVMLVTTLPILGAWWLTREGDNGQ